MKISLKNIKISSENYRKFDSNGMEVCGMQWNTSTKIESRIERETSSLNRKKHNLNY